MTSDLLARAGVRLARAPIPPGTPGTERGEEFGKTSPIALVVILLLGVATALLIRSMNKRLRNVPASFDADGGVDGAGGRPGDDVLPHDPDGPPTVGARPVDRTDPPPGTGSP